MGDAARRNLSIARDAARWRQLRQMLEVHSEPGADAAHAELTRNRLVFTAFLECWHHRTMTIEEMVDLAVQQKSAERFLAPVAPVDVFTGQPVS